MKFLDSNGLLYFWQKVKALIPKNTSDLTNDSGFITVNEVPETYVLPIADANVLGGVKIGGNIAAASGVISVANGTTSVKGVVQLTDGIASTSTTTAATPAAVKKAYDLANGKQSPAVTIAGYGITDAYTKTEIDGKLSSALTYKGSVATYAALPTSGNKKGDMWNVAAADAANNIKAGDNVAWDGASWDVLSGIVDLSAYVKASDTISNSEIDGILVL